MTSGSDIATSFRSTKRPKQQYRILLDLAALMRLAKQDLRPDATRAAADFSALSQPSARMAAARLRARIGLANSR
ncbi:hypothetical protein Bra471DRAFT_00733 [Bradyrhizobium sp. WSM471]|nr:hypothetical protein Bra471DRAFT_00733 [Bradyrhizobium sp. WSM471]